jgi:hypothetical protein
MAARRPTDPIEPMDLTNMRANGVRSLDVDEAMSGGERELLRTCGRWVTLARH